jgi:hypothetical protein
MKYPRAVLVFSIIISSSFITSLCAKEMPLWEGAAPGSKGQTPRDIPTLTHFPAAEKNNTGAAIVICPGGGYGMLAAHEGKELSNELQVTPKTPPTFLWHTANDPVVKVANSLAFAAAMSKAKVPFALHVFENGRHGLGLASKPPYKDIHPWAGDLIYWLHTRKFLVQSK